MHNLHYGIWIGCRITTVLAAAVTLLFAASTEGQATSGVIDHDATDRVVLMGVADGSLRLRLNVDGRCMLDRVIVHDREVIDPQTGVCTAIEAGTGAWDTTRQLDQTPKLDIKGSTVSVTGIRLAIGDVIAEEVWTFNVHADRIDWTIRRKYLTAGTLTDSYFPGWDFNRTDVWTAGLLDTGGVAWMRYLNRHATYGCQSGSVLFWKGDDALSIESTADDDLFLASRFSRQPSGVLTLAQSVTRSRLKTNHLLQRSINELDLWAPFQVEPGVVETTLTLTAPKTADARYRGEFKGLDGQAINNLLDTISRYGVIDERLVGGNGWLTGWICLHEPFFGQMGIAIADPNYTANLMTSLDDWRDLAMQPDGRVYSRWKHSTDDAMVPGTYDPETGYYECGWGILLDSNPDYVVNVAEAFDLSGDLDWLRSHKASCEKALEFMLARDSDGDGLLEMMNESVSEGKSSDWIDIVWAAWENGFVNARMYNALILWADCEQLLGDDAKARRYRAAAARLKAGFTRDIDDGGLWNPGEGFFVYWRDKDDSIHGNNFVTPVNFAAIAYGLATPEQTKAILEGAEERMRDEDLFHWPLCFTSFTKEEGGGWPFPDYENGDIFLPWGELGIRAYAEHGHPEIAVAYVQRLLAKYNHDGLSHQRYARYSQGGLGDDILAGNGNTIVGLYRNVFGVRPRHNRLLIDPHLTDELAGTTLAYPLRGERYDITLVDTASASVTTNGVTVTAPTPLAVSADGEGVRLWPDASERASITVVTGNDVAIDLQAWPSNNEQGPIRFALISGHSGNVSLNLEGFRVNTEYLVQADGEALSPITTDEAGAAKLQLISAKGGRTEFVLTPAQ